MQTIGRAWVTTDRRAEGGGAGSEQQHPSNSEGKGGQKPQSSAQPKKSEPRKPGRSGQTVNQADRQADCQEGVVHISQTLGQSAGICLACRRGSEDGDGDHSLGSKSHKQCWSKKRFKGERIATQTERRGVRNSCTCVFAEASRRRARVARKKLYPKKIDATSNPWRWCPLTRNMAALQNSTGARQPPLPFHRRKFSAKVSVSRDSKVSDSGLALPFGAASTLNVLLKENLVAQMGLTDARPKAQFEFNEWFTLPSRCG